MRNILTLLFLLTLAEASKAQSSPYVDTLYYLLDTASVPARERMLKLTTIANEQTFYTIDCPCRKNYEKPVFRFNTSLPLKITEAQVKQLKFISLPKLIDLVFKYDWPAYKEKFVTFFIEKQSEKYTMYKAHFEGAPPRIAD